MWHIENAETKVNGADTLGGFPSSASIPVHKNINDIDVLWNQYFGHIKKPTSTLMQEATPR